MNIGERFKSVRFYFYNFSFDFVINIEKYCFDSYN